MLSHNLKKINVKNQKKTKKIEIYNFQKISAVLADYGYCTIKLDDDWQGADFIAQYMFDAKTDGTKDFLKIQLKGGSRPFLNKKYEGKDIWLAFPYRDDWYLCPHDETKKYLEEKGFISKKSLEIYENKGDISIILGKDRTQNKIGKAMEGFKL